MPKNTLTDEQRSDLIAALIREREGYEQSGKTDRAKQVDAQLAAYGAGGKTPAKRSTKFKVEPAEQDEPRGEDE